MIKTSRIMYFNLKMFAFKVILLIINIFNFVLDIIKALIRKAKGPFMKFVIKRREADKRSKMIIKQQGIVKGIKSILSSYYRHLFYNRKTGQAVSLFLAPLVGVAILAIAISVSFTFHFALEVKYANVSVGFIQDESVYEQAIRMVNERFVGTSNYSSSATLPEINFVIASPEKLITADVLCDNIIKQSSSEISQGSGLYVDNVFLGATTESEKFDEHIRSIIEPYKQDGVVVGFSRDVVVKYGIYPNSSLKDLEDLKQIFEQINEEVIDYTVVSKDTVSKIATRFSMTVEDFNQLNNTPKTLKVGDVVKVVKKEQFIKVLLKTNTQEQLAIPYSTVKSNDPTLYYGSMTVTQRGVKGVEDATFEVVTDTEGNTLAKNKLSSVVITPPIEEVVKVGTKKDFIIPPDSNAGVPGKYHWPAADGFITSYMGDGRGHKGIDIAGPYGTAIYAADDGVVIKSIRSDGSGYGRYIVIEHADGYQTLYAHNSENLVTVGDTVKKGQVIALMGSTGNSTGNHVHFEVRKNGGFFNPMNFF